MYNRDVERLLELLSTFFYKSEIYRKENLIFLKVRGFDYVLEVMNGTVDINRNGSVVGVGFDNDLSKMAMRLARIIEKDSVHEKVLLKRTEKNHRQILPIRELVGGYVSMTAQRRTNMKIRSLRDKLAKALRNAKVKCKGESIHISLHDVNYQVMVVDGNLELWREGNILKCYAHEDIGGAANKAAKFLALDALGVYESRLEPEEEDEYE